MGITPAYAGKTATACFIIFVPRDHPRLRGKDVLYIKGSEPTPGSPPLTRERLTLELSMPSVIGITPAYAGKTSLPNEKFKGDEDHPI